MQVITRSALAASTAVLVGALLLPATLSGADLAKFRVSATCETRNESSGTFVDERLTVRNDDTGKRVEDAKARGTLTDLTPPDDVDDGKADDKTDSKGRAKLTFEFHDNSRYRIDYTVKKSGYKTFTGKYTFDRTSRKAGACVKAVGEFKPIVTPGP